MANEAWQTAFVEVVPEFKNFRKEANNQMGSVLASAGDAGGKRAGKGISAGVIGGLAGLAGGLLANAAADIGRFIGESIASGINYALDAVDLASDLGETQSAVRQVFGEAAKDIESFAAGANKNLGQTQQQALAAAQTFGVFGKSAGLVGPDLAEFSNGLSGLSADFASFYNTTPQEAIDAIGAGLRGEAEPLRRFGVLLDDATLKQEALKLGLIKTTKEALTPQSRILAAQSAIFARAGDAQGDFARTSDSLSNQQKILAASFADAQTKLGTALLPAMTQLTTIANDKLVPILGQVIDKVGPILADALVKSVPAFESLLTAIAPLLPDLVKLGAELLPVMVQSLVLLAPLIIDNVASLTAFFGQVNNIVGLLSGDKTFDQYAAGVRGLGGTFGGLINNITNVAANMSRFVGETRTNLTNFVSYFTGIPGRVKTALGDTGKLLLSSGKALIQGFIDGIKAMVGKLTSAVGGVMNIVAGFFPNSPAERGPFSGSGWTAVKHAGIAIGEQFSAGLNAATPTVDLAMGSLVNMPTGLNGAGALTGGSSSATGAGIAGGINIGTLVAADPDEAVKKLRTEQRRAQIIEGIDGAVFA